LETLKQQTEIGRMVLKFDVEKDFEETRDLEKD
jgi:hypothetical protein